MSNKDLERNNDIMERQMPYLSLKNITSACDGIYVGDEACSETVVSGVVIDSRLVEDNFLFVPIKGEKVDGHDFIPQVFKKGAACVLSERELEQAYGPYILVKSTKEALKKLAEFYREHLDIKVVGISGSVGKTSTKEMISSVLAQKYQLWKTAGNFNNEIGLPLTIFGIRQQHEIAVLEMGISDFGEMHILATMAKPDIAVITNIGLCHLENLGTRDGILQAKTEMFSHLQETATVILNGDDDKLITQKRVNGKDTIFYGIHGNENSIYATDVENLGFEGMKAKINTAIGGIEVLISIPGEHNVYNALAATAVGLELGLSLEEIKNGIESAKTIAGRTNLLEIHGMQVIDDCYNANPVSMEAALEVLSHGKGRTIAVLGDMGELGENERQLHYKVGECVGTKGIHTLFAAGKLAEEYKKAAIVSNKACKVFYFASREELESALKQYVKPGDNILIKASHFMDFPKVVDALKNI